MCQHYGITSTQLWKVSRTGMYKTGHGGFCSKSKSRSVMVELIHRDNYKITHEARLLGTDARLLDADAPNNTDGKLNKVVENVCYEYFKAVNENKIGCQLIFRILVRRRVDGQAMT